MNNPQIEPDHEVETARLVRAALDGPARPLRGDQLEDLVRRATAYSGSLFPTWALWPLTLAPLLIALLGWWNRSGWTGLLELALLVPLANLIFSPLAAYLIIHKGTTHETK